LGNITNEFLKKLFSIYIGKTGMEATAEIKDIFRVTVTTPDGYYIPSKSKIWTILSEHKKWDHTQTTEIAGGSTIFVIEFENVSSGEKAGIRNFCKNAIIKECVEVGK
jgi:hypothetical protein